MSNCTYEKMKNEMEEKNEKVKENIGVQGVQTR